MSIEARLLEVESRLQISELRAKYAWFIIRGMNNELAGLFTENAVFEYSIVDDPGKRNRVVGREALRKHYSNRTVAVRVPLVTNETIEIHGDKAHGTCAMFTPFSPTRAAGFGGYYHDRFAREERKWRFASRRYFLYWPMFEIPDGDVDPVSP